MGRTVAAEVVPMAGGFACPECGARVRLRGIAPGRQARCARCRTLIEVPFFPRAKKSRRPSDRERIFRLAAVSCLFVIALSLALIGAKMAWRARLQSSADAAMARLRDEVDAATRSGDPARLAEAAAAILMHEDLPWSDAEKADYRSRRDRAAREALDRDLAQLDGADPDRVISQGFDLWERSLADPALADATPDIEGRIETASAEGLRRAIAEGEAALTARDGPRSMAAIDAILDAQKGRPDWFRGPRIDAIRPVAGRIAAGFGAVIAPALGEFRLGSPEAYDRALRPPLEEALRLKGYVPDPRDPALSPLWARSAPYRLSIEVSESRGPAYLQSAHATTLIRVLLKLQGGGRPEWKAPTLARSQAPLPGLTAFESGRVSVATAPSVDFERRLHEDAFRTLVGNFGRTVLSLPGEKSGGIAADLPRP